MQFNVRRAALVVPFALLALFGALSMPALATAAPTQLLRFSAKGTLKEHDGPGGWRYVGTELNDPRADHDCPGSESAYVTDSYSGSAKVSYSGSATVRRYPFVNGNWEWRGTGSIKITMTSNETLLCTDGNTTKTKTAHTTIHWSVAKGAKFDYLTVEGRHLLIYPLPRTHLTYSVTEVQDGVTSHPSPFVLPGRRDPQVRGGRDPVSELSAPRPRRADPVTFPVSPWCFGPEGYGYTGDRGQLHAILTIHGRPWPAR